MQAGVLFLRNSAIKAAGSSARALLQALTTSSTSFARLCLSMYSWMEDMSSDDVQRCRECFTRSACVYASNDESSLFVLPPGRGCLVPMKGECLNAILRAFNGNPKDRIIGCTDI